MALADVAYHILTGIIGGFIGATLVHLLGHIAQWIRERRERKWLNSLVGSEFLHVARPDTVYRAFTRTHEQPGPNDTSATYRGVD